MAGIDNLKLALKFGINLTEAVLVKLEDKKLTWLEALGLVPELIDLPKLIRDAELLWDELADLTSEENDELIAYAKAEFNLDDDKVEDVVEDVLQLVSSLANLAFDIKALKEE